MSLFLVLSILIATVFGASTRSDIDTNGAPFFGGRIKHIIVIMLENRSFDHMLGYSRTNRTNIDGCLPSLGEQCSNPYNSSDPNSKIVYVDDGAIYIQPGDPDHSVDGTSLQLYGQYADNGENYYPAPMKGFVESYATRDKKLKYSPAN